MEAVEREGEGEDGVIVGAVVGVEIMEEEIAEEGEEEEEIVEEVEEAVGEMVEAVENDCYQNRNFVFFPFLSFSVFVG